MVNGDMSPSLMVLSLHVDTGKKLLRNRKEIVSIRIWHIEQPYSGLFSKICEESFGYFDFPRWMSSFCHVVWHKIYAQHWTGRTNKPIGGYVF